MKICHIGTIIFENEDSNRELKAIGGISHYICELIRTSLNKNIKIIFVGKIFNYHSLENLRYYQVQNKLTSTNKFLLYLFFNSLLIKFPKDIIIHAHRPDHLAAFTFFKKNPSVITLHGQQIQTINIRKGNIIKLIYQVLEKKAVNKAKFLIAVDNVTKSLYSQLYPKQQAKIRVIPTGVNTDLFKPMDKVNARIKLGIWPDDKVIVYVGRVEPPKKIAEIIKAFKILQEEERNLKLLIIGDGVLLQEMKNLAKDLVIPGTAVFFGVRKRNELPLIYNAADISVLYSGNEGSPLSVKESLACGIPVVANSVGDISELIQDGINGYVIKNESIWALANTMKLCIQNASTMQKASVESIADYTVDQVNQKVIELYKEIYYA